jgi:hypothetical protein
MYIRVKCSKTPIFAIFSPATNVPGLFPSKINQSSPLSVMTVDGMANDKEAKNDPLHMSPILALRNSAPYNCLEVHEKVIVCFVNFNSVFCFQNKREEMQHCGDFKYLMDYVKKRKFDSLN